MFLNDAKGDCQSKTRSHSLILGGIIGIKYSFSVFMGNPMAGITDRQFQIMTGFEV